jgi:hypothetical protein
MVVSGAPMTWVSLPRKEAKWRCGCGGESGQGRYDHFIAVEDGQGSVTWCGGMLTSARGDATSGRGKGGDDVSWDDTNLTGPKNEENPCSRFSCYK